MPDPFAIGVVKGVREPLLFQKLITILAQVKGFATSASISTTIKMLVKTKGIYRSDTVFVVKMLSEKYTEKDK